MRLPLASLVLVTACSQAPKQPVHEDFSSLDGQDEKSDVFSHRMRVIASLQFGMASPWLSYSSTPRYRAVKFQAAGGDKVDVWVRSNDGGDAVAWLLDNRFRTLAVSDDAEPGLLDSHIVTTLPAGPRATHYIVYRDYDVLPATFSVQLAGGPNAPECTLDSECAGIALADGKVPLCNNETRVCERVAIEDIVCGGFLPPNPHQCPPGYTCITPPLTLDAPGRCEPE